MKMCGYNVNEKNEVLYNNIEFVFFDDNKIKFDEHLDDDLSEVYFQMKCFLKSKYFMYVPNAVYVAPNPNISCR